MVKEPAQTAGDLRRKAVATDGEIAEAIEAYLSDPKSKAFCFASGHVLDVAVAAAARTTASTAFADPKAEHPFQRTTIRTAVIMTVLSAP